MALLQDKIAFLAKLFKDVQVARDNIEISVRCPECGKPGKSKLCIRLDNEIYHCWVCDLKGRGIARLVGMISPSKKSQYMARFPQANAKTVVEAPIEIRLPEDFKLLGDDTNDPYAREIKNYAHSRGFSAPMLWRYRCGYSRIGKWYRRLLMPSFDEDGNLNYLTGRAIDKNNHIRYVNESLPKKDIIFNEIDVDFGNRIVLVEGPLDLIKCGVNSTCLLGSTLNENSLLFERITKNATPVVLLLDPDAQNKAMKIAKLLSSYSIDVWLNCPLEKDVGDCEFTEVAELIRESKKYSQNSLILAKLQGLRI